MSNDNYVTETRELYNGLYEDVLVQEGNNGRSACGFSALISMCLPAPLRLCTEWFANTLRNFRLGVFIPLSRSPIETSSVPPKEKPASEPSAVGVDFALNSDEDTSPPIELDRDWEAIWITSKEPAESTGAFSRIANRQGVGQESMRRSDGAKNNMTLPELANHWSPGIMGYRVF